MTNEVEVAPPSGPMPLVTSTVVLRAVTDGEVQLIALGEVVIRE